MKKSLLDKEIEELESNAKAHPYAANTYDSLIVLLRTKNDPLRLHGIHLQRADHVWPSLLDIAAWELDILRAEDPLLRYDMFCQFYPKILSYHPTSKYWTAYLEFALDSTHKKMDPSSIESLLERAKHDCAYDFKGSSSVWQIIFDYYKNGLSLTPENTPWSKVLDIYMDRLRFPHVDIDTTESQLSELVLIHEPQNYDQIMLQASAVAAKNRIRQRHIEFAESNLIESDPRSWQNYIENIANHTKDFSEVSCLFNRFLCLIQSSKTNEKMRLDVWSSYINLLFTRGKAAGDGGRVLLLFMKAFPSSPRMCVEFVTWAEQLPDSMNIIEQCLRRVDPLGVIEYASQQEFEDIAVTLCSYYYRNAVTYSHDTVHGHLEMMASCYYECLAELEKIPSFYGLRMILEILIKKDYVHDAEKLVKTIVQAHPTSSEAWLLGIKLYTSIGTEMCQVIRYFDAALDKAPSREIIHQYLLYSGIHMNAVGVAETKRKCTLATERLSELSPSSGDKSASDDSKTAEKKTTESTEVKRSREDFCVKVAGVGRDVDKADVSKHFSDCGEVLSCHSYEDNDALYYTLEFANEGQVLLALTKSLKVFKGNQIQVTRLLQSTVFVTNYPPTMSQDNIRNFFSTVGAISNIRFPTQKPGTPSRRFCYIEYGDSTSAQAAVTLYNDKRLQDKEDNLYQIKVSISRPNEKGSRKARFSERKVRVTNLPFSLTDSEVRQVFEKFGSIESIQFPRIRRERNAKHCNDGIAMILYGASEDADRAADARAVLVSGRTVNVQKHSQDAGNQTGPAPAEGNTIQIENVDETLTLEQCRASIEAKVEHLALMQLGPEPGMATLSFDSEKDAGKAALVLDNHALNGKQIKVVSGPRTEGGATKRQKLMVPTTLKRRKVV